MNSEQVTDPSPWLLHLLRPPKERLVELELLLSVLLDLRLDLPHRKRLGDLTLEAQRELRDRVVRSFYEPGLGDRHVDDLLADHLGIPHDLADTVLIDYEWNLSAHCSPPQYWDPCRPSIHPSTLRVSPRGNRCRERKERVYRPSSVWRFRFLRKG